MIINWYPGHMDKALRMMETELDLIDVAVYVLDSRAPFSCVNPVFEGLLKSKPIIYVLNKADLVLEADLKKWQKYFSGENKVCITLNSTESNSSKKLLDAIKSLHIKKLVKNEKRGITIPLRMMILGVPNCGKSTLINNLCGKGKTITGDKAGVTRGKQWVAVASNLEVLDTPGTLWPNLENTKVAHNLAYIGSIKDDVLDISSLALDFIIDMLKLDKQILENRYKISIDLNSIKHIFSETTDYGELYDNEELKMFALEVYEKVCLVRGFMMKNREFDYERCAKALLDDFRKNRLGKIILD